MILAAVAVAALSVLVSALCHLVFLDVTPPDPSQGGGAAELRGYKAQIMADGKRLAILADIVNAHGARLDMLEKPRVEATAPAAQPLAGGARALARVELRSSPPGAAVFRGRKRIASTPATISLELPADLVVTRSGYRPSRVRATQPGEIEVRLVRRRSQSKAAAEIADKPAGVTAPDPAQARPAP